MSGVKHDQGKPRYDLIPPEALRAIASQLTYGAEKYGDRNWEQGIHFGRLVRAAFGHLTDFWAGEDNDEEGRPHLHGAITSLAMLLASVERFSGSEWDDRPVKVSRPDVHLNYETGHTVLTYNPNDWSEFTFIQNTPVDTSVNSAETDHSTGDNTEFSGYKVHYETDHYGGPWCKIPNYRRFTSRIDQVTCKTCLTLIDRT